MSGLLGMERKKLAIGGMMMAAIFFFFLNILATGEIKTAQLDLTQDKLFTLSDGTKEILRTIDEPLTFRFYYSSKFGEISPLHGNYSKRVQEMLEQIALVSDGKVKVNINNPEPFSIEEDEAVKMGIQGIPLDQSAEMVLAQLIIPPMTGKILHFNPQRDNLNMT